jgi:hypothetical protein
MVLRCLFIVHCPYTIGSVLRPDIGHKQGVSVMKNSKADIAVALNLAQLGEISKNGSLGVTFGDHGAVKRLSNIELLR